VKRSEKIGINGLINWIASGYTLAMTKTKVRNDGNPYPNRAHKTRNKMKINALKLLLLSLTMLQLSARAQLYGMRDPDSDESLA
jgi:hypothetical protein